MKDKLDVAWSCIVDDTPDIWSCVVPWLASLTELADVMPSRIHVHHVCPFRPEIEQPFHALQVNTHLTEPFDPRHPHTNKIRQCATDFGDVRYVLLTDVDVAFVSRPPFHEIKTPVAGKLVYMPNPPIEILRKVFSVSGIPVPRSHKCAYFDSDNIRVDFETLHGNFNGGLYVLDRDHLDRTGESWARWADWLIAKIHLLASWSRHVDQVSFCLAMNELRIDAGPLEDAWNFPTRLNVALNWTEPFILHHHALLDHHLRLKQVSAIRGQGPINRVNNAIVAFRRKHLLV